jgi:ppGpp synthetase/RelA/SpoT-type nucleotidyltranferase
VAEEEAHKGNEAKGNDPSPRKDDHPAEPPIPAVLRSQYAEQKPVLDKALGEIREIALRQIGRLKDHSLVRAQVAEARVKELPSLWAKAQRNEWRPDEALTNATDLIGLRLVCNNLEDVERVKDLLRQAPEFKFVEGSLQDYYATPQDTGYRAMHYLVAYDVSPAGKTANVTVTCEVQIRTYLADAWARLAHQDLYKEGPALAPYLRKLFQRLAGLLKVTDDIAQDIREEVSRPRIVAGQPPTTGVEPDSLAFIYQMAFGALAPDYILQVVVTRCREFNVTRADALDRKLRDKAFVESLKLAYAEEHGLELHDEDVFEFIPIAVAMGDQAALNRVKQRAQAYWEEIDAHYKSELKAELPETYEEFMDSLKSYDHHDPEGVSSMVYDLARAFDATSSCIICGATIVETDALAEAIAEHYDLQDKMQEIEPELSGSGVETGYEGDSTYCNHCGYMLNKDD